MEDGKHVLSLQEKELYHQIHPAKLSTDIASAILSLYLLWIHQLILGLLGGFVPSIVASALIIRYINLDSYAASPLGKYIRRYMTRSMEAVRFVGLFVFWFGAWFHTVWIIGVGCLIVVLGWVRGKIVP